MKIAVKIGPGGLQEYRRRVVELYVDVAAEILPQHFRKDCCLNGTRVFLEVARTFKLPASAQPVEMLVLNEPWVRLMNEWGRWPHSERDRDEMEAAGAWAIGVGLAGDRETTTHWPGHLVALSCGMLVDSSTGQADRRSRGIALPPVSAFTCEQGFVSSGRTDSHEVDDCIVTYRARTDIQFDHCDGFQRSPWNLEVADEVTREIARRLTKS